MTAGRDELAELVDLDRYRAEPTPLHLRVDHRARLAECLAIVDEARARAAQAEPEELDPRDQLTPAHRRAIDRARQERTR